MKAQTILGAVVLFGASVHGLQRTILGCYKSTLGLAVNDTYQWNSYGHCSGRCTNSTVFGMMDNKCYCGAMLPPDSDKVDGTDPKCNKPCDGFPTADVCGSGGLVLVYDGGVSAEIPKASATASSSASATGTSKSTSSTASKETVLVTPSGQANGNSSKPNTAGIAAGVVIGVLAIAGIAGGAFFFVRNRKRRAIEEEHRRNAAVSSFIGSGKPSSSGGASSFTDTRLDPVMAQRRMSDGSIADNQDYSRRILKVTNA